MIDYLSLSTDPEFIKTWISHMKITSGSCSECGRFSIHKNDCPESEEYKNEKNER